MATVIKSKARVFGESLNTKELLEALRHPLFTDVDSPVQVHTQFNTGFLKLIFLCPNCETFHFCSGEFSAHIHKSQNEVEEVLLDKSGAGEYISQGDLIDLLTSLTETKNVTLEYSGEEQSFTLTEVLKCDHCKGVHLDCSYNRDCLGLN